MIQKITGPLDVTLALGLAAYAVAYLGLQVLCEVHGFANPTLARQRHEQDELEELAHIGRIALSDAAGGVEWKLGELA